MRRALRAAGRDLFFLARFAVVMALVGFVVGLTSCASIDERSRLSAQACDDLPMQRAAFGLAAGDRVIDRVNVIGELRGFACVDRVPLGLVESGGELRRVRVAELRSYPR